MDRKWFDGIIVGICIALAVALIQPLAARDGGWSQLVGLGLAAALVGIVQILLFFLNKTRS